jgi:hypothetical protein
MGFTAAEIRKQMADKGQREADQEAERTGTQKPRNTCIHPPTRGVRCTMFKGAKPMHVTYCEDCGAMGPAGGIPTLGSWVDPQSFRQS